MHNNGERIFSAVHIRNQYFIRTKSIYCIFLLLVASHNYLQYELSKYTAVHLTYNGESILH